MKGTLIIAAVTTAMVCDKTSLQLSHRCGKKFFRNVSLWSASANQDALSGRIVPGLAGSRPGFHDLVGSSLLGKEPVGKSRVWSNNLTYTLLLIGNHTSFFISLDLVRLSCRKPHYRPCKLARTMLAVAPQFPPPWAWRKRNGRNHYRIETLRHSSGPRSRTFLVHPP